MRVGLLRTRWSRDCGAAIVWLLVEAAGRAESPQSLLRRRRIAPTATLTPASPEAARHHVQPGGRRHRSAAVSILPCWGNRAHQPDHRLVTRCPAGSILAVPYPRIAERVHYP